ncbi:hypothetical protein [Ferrimonas marina]|uniref:Uncharacterized protein n=1 Tax=Ferrimonas marina TaxID=299255 RepID=A0A1M5U697_9GAMM|nr:hypothetical protein [Ferrimonas marina]SHH58243.1 hypothetical protein SAMN02745129_2417 [Ferrimonas marina]
MTAKKKASSSPVPKCLKVGQVFYSANIFTTDGKTELEIEEWHIRTLRVPNTRANGWAKNHLPSSYANQRARKAYLVLKHDLTYDSKAAKRGLKPWKSSIPDLCRKEFSENADHLPHGLFTTPLQALLYLKKEHKDLLPDLQGDVEYWKAETQAMKEEQGSVCPTLTEELEQAQENVEAHPKELVIIATRITKLRNQQKKHTRP